MFHSHGYMPGSYRACYEPRVIGMNTSGKVPAVLKGIIVMIVSRGKEPLLLRVRFGSQNWPWSRGDVSSELLMLRMTHPWQ